MGKAGSGLPQNVGFLKKTANREHLLYSAITVPVSPYNSFNLSKLKKRLLLLKYDLLWKQRG